MKNFENRIINIIKNKNVLFITHKGVGYIRNSQEIRLIKKKCIKLKIIQANAKLSWSNYFFSIIRVYFCFLFIPKRSYDVIFIGYLPQFLLPFISFLLKDKIIVIDFFISLYDTIVFDKQLISSRNFISGILKWWDIISLKKAHYVIVDTKTHREYFSKEFYCPIEKMTVLYLEADKKLYYPHKVRKNKEFKNKYLVLYFGTILPLQGVDIILEALIKLRENIDIHFLIIGPIKKAILSKYNRLKNGSFIPWVKQEELSDYIAMSDLCLAGHFNSNIKKASRVIPGKAYIYEAMNKIMILGENKANRELFSDQDQRHYFVKMGDSKKLSEKILEIKRGYR